MILVVSKQKINLWRIVIHLCKLLEVISVSLQASISTNSRSEMIFVFGYFDSLSYDVICIASLA